MSEKTKSLFGYIFPALGGLFVTYLYNIVDGIFVGQGVGAAALGAVNIGVPFITLVVAIAAVLPMVGATVVAIRMGRGDKKGANHAFMTAFSLTVLLSVLLMVAGMAFSRQIVDLSGARELSDKMREMSAQYLFYYSAFIFLDWLFIFPLDMGIIGAAVASGLGQVFSVLVLLSHFVRKKGALRITVFRKDFLLMKKICKRGVPEAVTQLTTPVTAFCYNLMLARMVGDIGVSTFSVLSFIYSLANAILSGVAQGLQPLWGHCYGKRDTGEMGWYFHCGIIINSILSVLIYGTLFFFDKPVICIFNQDADLVQTASAVLPVFSLSFIPMGVNLIYTAYLFSTKRTGAANAIAISRGLIVKSLAIFCIPMFFGSDMIWIAPFIAEIVTFIFAARLCKASPLVW